MAHQRILTLISLSAAFLLHSAVSARPADPTRSGSGLDEVIETFAEGREACTEDYCLATEVDDEELHVLQLGDDLDSFDDLCILTGNGECTPAGTVAEARKDPKCYNDSFCECTTLFGCGAMIWEYCQWGTISCNENTKTCSCSIL